MIVGVGVDLCDSRRIGRAIDRFGERFLARCFTDAERALCERRGARVASYARRWAAKEACAKALGTGLEVGVSWREIEVASAPGGRPTLALRGAAAEALAALAPSGHATRAHLSLSDEGPYVQAFVVLEAA